MILRRDKRIVPQLNTTSTADISFILLVFFLIMTSMDTDKGLARMLPPMSNEQKQEQPTDIERSNVLSIKLTAESQLIVDDKTYDINLLRQRVATFADAGANRQKRVIKLEVDRNAAYDTYFNVQNEIVAAYNALRNRYALKKYGRSYAMCTPEERDAIRSYYPQQIIETITGDGKGGEQ